jgi:peptidoglycan/xylan/chitin deacetylase (PgdA/CDA1 family)
MHGLRKRAKTVIGHLAAATGLYQWRFGSLSLVTAFHRVSDVIPEDGLTCSSQKFEAFCKFFSEHFRVVSLAEQVSGWRSGRDVGGTLSITFDDGYLDNFEVAAPILRKHNLPATFFIATGFIDSERVPIWDENLPQAPKWMSWDHVRELSCLGFDIGCHTVSHLDMGRSPMDLIELELHGSKAALQEQLGRPVDLFAYPFGGPEHISDESRSLVRDAGFICCASCYGGTNDNRTNPFNIRRIGIAQWFETPHQFGAELLRESILNSRQS